MTEKRFTFAYETNDQYCIWWAVRDGDITLWKEEVIHLLNELHEENKQLKQKEIDFLEKRYAEVCYLKNKIDGLEKENEQLKQYKEAIWGWDSSKIIRVNKNTGEVDLVDKELKE